MKSWTIGKRIVFGFAVISLISLGLGVFAVLQLHRIGRDSDEIREVSLPGTFQAGQLAEKIQYLGNQISTLALKSLLSKNEDIKADLAVEVGKNQDAITALSKGYERTLTTEDERVLFVAFSKARDRYFALLNQLLKLSADGKVQEGMELKQNELEPSFEGVLATVHAHLNFSKSNADHAGAQIAQSVSFAKKGIIVGLVGVLVAAVGISLVIIVSTSRVLKRIAHSLGENSERVAAAAANIYNVSQLVADGESQQAASLEETSASLEEMATMTRANAEHAETAKQLSHQTRTAAEAGSTDMGEMDTAMEAIKVSGDNIAKIIRSIDQIAFQTNILALNAAVEAARAGEAGLGFAVVADEVKNLAQRSAQSAKETTAKVEDSINKSEQGVGISAKIANSLKEIVDRARKVDELIGEIATASKEQSEGILQVNRAVTQMDKVTQGNAERASEAATAAGDLNSEAAGMKEAVRDLMMLVGGRQTTFSEKTTTDSAEYISMEGVEVTSS